MAASMAHSGAALTGQALRPRAPRQSQSPPSILGASSRLCAWRGPPIHASQIRPTSRGCSRGSAGQRRRSAVRPLGSASSGSSSRHWESRRTRESIWSWPRAGRAGAVAVCARASVKFPQAPAVEKVEFEVEDEEFDVVVIGAGLGGLCAGGLLARYGFKVLICESHVIPGGAAHAFVSRGFHFDSGPSFHAGLSLAESVNPLKQVLDILGESVECVQYKTWIGYFPNDVTFTFTADAQAYRDEILRVGGEDSLRDWLALEQLMAPVAKAAVAIPAAALRQDPWNLLTVARFLPRMLPVLPSVPLLLQPFSVLVDKAVTDPFLGFLMQLECFVLSGMLPDSTISAEIATMFFERNRVGGTIDYPLGGGGSVVDALVKGFKKWGGALRLGTHVGGILQEGGKAAGVLLAEEGARKVVAAGQAGGQDLPRDSTGGILGEGRSGNVGPTVPDSRGVGSPNGQLAQVGYAGESDWEGDSAADPWTGAGSMRGTNSTVGGTSSGSSSSGKGGLRRIRARRAVLSNASIWDTARLLLEKGGGGEGGGGINFQGGRRSISPSDAGSGYEEAVRGFAGRAEKTNRTGSFMHLHLGIRAEGLPQDLECHHLVVNDWGQPIDAPQNVVIVSIPSVFDASLAPAGCHTVHVYTAGNEPYEIWEGLDRRSKQYRALKEERSQVLWGAIERVIPDVRQRSVMHIVGTPLTHARYLRRHKGTYGPAVRAGEEDWPGPISEVPGLLCCGDSTMPGIGVPSVAASGMMAANCLLPIKDHLDLLQFVKLNGK